MAAQKRGNRGAYTTTLFCLENVLANSDKAHSKPSQVSFSKILRNIVSIWSGLKVLSVSDGASVMVRWRKGPV